MGFQGIGNRQAAKITISGEGQGSQFFDHMPAINQFFNRLN